MLNHLTPQRLATVERFFQTRNDSDLLGCYAWTQAVSSGLLPILGDFEVAFRNALHRSLSLYYSNGQSTSFDWMMPRPNPAYASNPGARPFLLAHHSMGVGSRDNIAKAMGTIMAKKPRGYVITPDDVVAALSFGFWEKIIESLDHRSHRANHPGLQANILGQVVPHASLSLGQSFGDLAFKDRLTRLLTRVRDIRNRIGHHDAIWSVPEFDTRGHVGFIPRRPRHAAAALDKAAEKVAWLAGWIDPAIPAYMRQTDHWWSFKALLNRQALAIYRQRGGCIETFKTMLDQAASPAAIGSRRPEKARQILDRIKLRSHHF